VTGVQTCALPISWDDNVTGMDFRREGSGYQPLEVP